MVVAAPRFVPRVFVGLPPVVAVIGAGDPSSSRLVYAMVVGLVLVGVAFIILGVWILRQTRPDLEVLAPLERMGDREWSKRDPATQRRMLDEIRPRGASPLRLEPSPPPLDADFDQLDHPVTSFSDLGPGVPSQPPEHKDPTPTALEVAADRVDAVTATADKDEKESQDQTLSDPHA